MNDIDKLRDAWNKLLDEIAKALRLYKILDFMVKVLDGIPKQRKVR